jgi:tetratricopeptide (TPR) repeat protein
MHLGQYEKAIEGFEHAKKLMPDFVYSYVSIAFADSSLGHLADAKASLDALRPHGFDPEMAWPRYYEIAFLQNNSQEMDRQLSIGLNRPQDKGDALWYRACADFYHGRVAKARDLFHRAALAQVDSGFNEHAAAKQARVARQFADSGIDIAAKSAAETALSMGASRWSKAEVATVFAEIGEAGRAKALIKELRTSYPSDTILNRYWLPVVNASLLIRERHALEAISTLGPATDYELGGSGPIYPAYVRGCAYLAAHNGPAAVTEFQKLIDHPGIVFNDATGALARRQLGRAYALMGDRANARKAFEAFFELWKDADPNIPVLKQAKTECAKLLRSPE